MGVLTGLAKKIVTDGLLSEDKMQAEVDNAAVANKPIVSHLVESGIIPALSIASIASQEFGMPYLDLDAFDTTSTPQINLKFEEGTPQIVLPLFQRGDKLFVAISDPSSLLIMESIKFQTGLSPEPIIVESDKLAKLIEHSSASQGLGGLSDMDSEGLDGLDITSGEEESDDGTAGADDAPIVRFINKVLLDAINSGASDIHFEPYEKTCRIRFRQDGILREHATPPQTLATRLAARIKVMAQLDISERRIPQDGRFKMRISKSKAIDFRISSCPTLWGEKIVMRILDPTSAQIGIDQLGYEPFQKELFMKAINLPQGMVLVTGPTGSGKTVSLYTALNILNVPERNISTAEDPVEINLPGINQVNVRTKIGLTFSAALKSFLRQDPDVIMVGEIRDLETAEIAIKAAQTGHMVLSTLHTNSAADTLTRLINMGIPAFNLATSVNLIIAQRLARRLCEKCKQQMDIPMHAKLEMGFTQEEAEKLLVYKPIGCNNCKEGYKGRLGLYEVMPITPAIVDLILKGANAVAIREQAAKEGVWNVRQSGLNKLKLGLTTFDEVYRVSKE